MVIEDEIWGGVGMDGEESHQFHLLTSRGGLVFFVDMYSTGICIYNITSQHALHLTSFSTPYSREEDTHTRINAPHYRPSTPTILPTMTAASRSQLCLCVCVRCLPSPVTATLLLLPLLLPAPSTSVAALPLSKPPIRGLPLPIRGLVPPSPAVPAAAEVGGGDMEEEEEEARTHSLTNPATRSLFVLSVLADTPPRVRIS